MSENETDAKAEALNALRAALSFFGSNLTQDGFQITSEQYANNLSAGLWQLTNALIKIQESSADGPKRS